MPFNVAALLKDEGSRMVSRVDIVVAAALKDPEVIASLIPCLTSPDEGLALRASEALYKLHLLRPQLLQYDTVQILKILNYLEMKGTHTMQAAARNLKDKLQ